MLIRALEKLVIENISIITVSRVIKVVKSAISVVMNTWVTRVTKSISNITVARLRSYVIEKHVRGCEAYEDRPISAGSLACGWQQQS